ncbi:hypothetical protein NFI96_031572 [Prochilodus magdalenae]|nr:hypothetical protein NFI96_031572 [Prochilodus magdalenae]
MDYSLDLYTYRVSCTVSGRLHIPLRTDSQTSLDNMEQLRSASDPEETEERSSSTFISTTTPTAASRRMAFYTRRLQDLPKVTTSDVQHSIQASPTARGSKREKGFQMYVSSYIDNYEETWLSPEIPNEAIEPARFSVHRADRTKDLSGRSKGGGVCFMISAWCDQRNVHFIESFFSPDIEYLTISCRPRWLLRETSGVTVTTVYIPPQAGTDLALGKLYEAVNRQEAARPEVRPTCLMQRERITLAYKPLPRPPFGKSDHSSILLLPTYRQKLKQAPPTIREVHRWSDQSDSMLQDCFDHVDWEMFREALMSTQTL